MNFIRGSSRLATGLAIAGTTVLLLAGPASADTSQARATAATVTLLNTSILDTGEVAASNDGTTETVTGQAGTVVLGGVTLLTAGVLAQDATAETNGTSAACAGAVGSGGSIQVGAALDCTANIGTPDGVTLDLGGALLPNIIPGLPAIDNLFTLGADAIYAECTATTAGETGSATLVDANIFLSILGITTPTPLDANPGPNTQINVLNLGVITTNEQINNPDGSLTVNALHIELLPTITGTTAADIIIGSVTCGPNAVTAPISLVSGPALPVALTATAAVGAVVFLRRRQTA